MSIRKTVNSGFKLADTGLRFIQSNFNTSNDYKSVIAVLEYYSANYKDDEAKRLIDRKEDIEIMQGNNLAAEFENITEQIQLIGSNTVVLRLADELIFKLGKTNDWVLNYNIWLFEQKQINIKNQLLELGKAILGLASERCPIKTGRLRSSGRVIQNGNYVIVGFFCPYAVYVHECFGYRHLVGQSKFLETAVQDILPNAYTWVDVFDKGSIAVKIEIV